MHSCHVIYAIDDSHFSGVARNFERGFPNDRAGGLGHDASYHKHYKTVFYIKHTINYSIVVFDLY